MIQAAYTGPLGRLLITEQDGVIIRLRWAQDGADTPSDLLKTAVRQLDEYFAGTRQAFDLPLDFGTGLHEKVRRAMAAIPYGETRTYGDLSRSLNAPAQAIGQACGANPIPILIPCHRVLGAKTLGGFSAPGGIETKIALLKLEGAASLLI
ncbi:MAG: methylated-DNA--[protein]-cysteine S-methyltransferase [Paracoccaceae bacterium]